MALYVRIHTLSCIIIIRFYIFILLVCFSLKSIPHTQLSLSFSRNFSHLLAAVNADVGGERCARYHEMARSFGDSTPGAPASGAGGGSCVGVAVVVARRRPRHSRFGHAARPLVGAIGRRASGGHQRRKRGRGWQSCRARGRRLGGCNEPSRLGSSLRSTELCSNHGDTRPRRPSHPRD